MAEGISTGVEARRGRKSAAAFRTISEVAGELDVPQHVLRFWETKFAHIKPLKRGGGRRYYRPEDISLLWRIKTLLYDDGYTIKGVQKLLREGVIKSAPDSGELVLERSVMPKVKKASMAPKARAEVEAVLGDLIAVREMMRRGS